MALSLLRTVECMSFKDTFERMSKVLWSMRKTNKKSSDMEMDEVTELLNLLKDTKNAWRTSISNYEFMTENELIDYYTYQIKAYELRFEYLLKKAKQKGITAKFYEGI